MRLIKRISVSDGQRERHIGLYAGDLSQIAPAYAVDLLVVSAFPNDYAPIDGTLIGALQGRGLSLAALARDKAYDLRDVSGFWMSKPLDSHQDGLHVERIACFEPLAIGQPPEVVGQLFRGLFPLLDQERDSVVAMPLLGGGNQGWPAQAMLPPLLQAASRWMRRGLPIKELMIVEIREDRIAALAAEFDAFESRVGRAFDAPLNAPAQPREQAANEGSAVEKVAADLAPVVAPHPSLDVDPAPGGSPPADPFAPAPEFGEPQRAYDVFLSYAEEDRDAATRLAATLRQHDSGMRIFDYRLSIDIGQSWQQEIDEAIESCAKIVAVMSPDYFASPECNEELMIARLRNKRSNFDVFFPLYWRATDRALALWLQAITYSDCREQDLGKLDAMTRRLVEQFRGS